MGSKKEIRLKIASIKNTQKITKAMEMVAASKMRRTQDKMRATRPYAASMVRIIEHLSKATPEYHHTYFKDRGGKDAGIIMVSSDRGLCGGLNTNLFRYVIRQVRNRELQGGKVFWGSIGQKSTLFLNSIGQHQEAKVTHLGDIPTLEPLRGVILSMLKLYDEGKVDSVWLASNEFVNTMTQRPRMVRLLPIPPVNADGEEVHTDLKDNLERKGPWDYLYEPDAREILDALMIRYVESMVFRAVVENGAAEQAARMVAMKNASENAGRLIKEFQLAYNKARQASITQEIAEIVAGASAV